MCVCVCVCMASSIAVVCECSLTVYCYMGCAGLTHKFVIADDTYKYLVMVVICCTAVI